jgi:hypothetical protein
VRYPLEVYAVKKKSRILDTTTPLSWKKYFTLIVVIGLANAVIMFILEVFGINVR